MIFGQQQILNTGRRKFRSDRPFVDENEYKLKINQGNVDYQEKLRLDALALTNAQTAENKRQFDATTDWNKSQGLLAETNMARGEVQGITNEFKRDPSKYNDYMKNYTEEQQIADWINPGGIYNTWAKEHAGEDINIKNNPGIPKEWVGTFSNYFKNFDSKTGSYVPQQKGLGSATIPEYIGNYYKSKNEIVPDYIKYYYLQPA